MVILGHQEHRAPRGPEEHQDPLDHRAIKEIEEHKDHLDHPENK